MAIFNCAVLLVLVNNIPLPFLFTDFLHVVMLVGKLPSLLLAARLSFRHFLYPRILMSETGHYTSGKRKRKHNSIQNSQEMFIFDGRPIDDSFAPPMRFRTASETSTRRPFKLLQGCLIPLGRGGAGLDHNVVVWYLALPREAPDVTDVTGSSCQ